MAAPASARATTSASESATAPPPALVPLPVPGFDPAIVSFPARTGAREPVVVVAHGAGVVPEHLCRTVRRLLGERGVLLCLAGPRVAVHDEGRYFPDHHALDRIFVASVEALEREHGDRIDGERALYVGYSQGATMGALMIPEHADRCARLVLVEGGFGQWTLARAQAFRDHGGNRVLFACGTSGCAKGARASADLFRRVGVAVDVIVELSAGHTYGGSLAQKVEERIAWITEGDPRF